MMAIIGFILFIIAAIINLLGKHPDWVIWIIIVAGALVCAEVAWGWNRGGRYSGRRTRA